jgi:hypothetical protein
MPEIKQHIELRSEEVQEILEAVPNWMIRWGNTLVFVIICGLLVLSWFMKYPDVISSSTIVTTKFPPQKEYCNITGRIDTVFVLNKQRVTTNSPLGIIENSANYKDVFLLKSIIDSLEVDKHSFQFPVENTSMLFLGDINSSYTIFENNYLEYKINRETQTSLKEQNIERKKVLQSFNQLKSAVKNWETNYLLVSNIYGTVSFARNWKNNTEVSKGDLTFIIIPENPKGYIAKLKAPTKNSGKLKLNQVVNINLESHPQEEYGYLKGHIESISPITDVDGFYLIDVRLPAKLITSYDKEIIFKQEMRGTAEIITEDLRLIERFFYQLRGLFSG